MFAFGMFDNPQTGSLSATVTSAAHQQTALQLGEEGTVLLKNNGILPLNPNGTESIAVIGTDGGAGVELAGGGSGTVTSSNTIWPITGIQDAVGPNVKVTYTAGQRQRHHRHPAGGRRRPGRDRRDHLRQRSRRARRAT